MKKKYFLGYTLALMLALTGCEQEMIDLQDPEPDLTNISADTCPDDATSGSADFTKFVAVGNSFVAGVQGGALFTEGQNNSLPAILNKQFQCVGAPATFNQPTIGASLGWNLFVTQPFLSDNSQPILGRMLLQYGTDPDCETGEVSPVPTPQPYAVGTLEALPNPTFNPGFMYTGSKTELNNFGVAAVTLGQLLTSATGNWGNPDPAVGFTPFYGRFASAPGSSTIISDAKAANGTFFLFWAGLDDFFLYAAFGGDPNYAPAPINGPTFSAYLNAALNASNGLLSTSADVKGVVGNFPDIFAMPHFTAVSYNPIPLDATNAAALTAGFAGYNNALNALIANKNALGISDELAAEIATRKFTFTAGCNNKILLIDETLEDLGPYFDALGLEAADRAGLVPYEQVRQSTATDIIPLSTGAILGEEGDFGLLGVSEPVGDRYVIIPDEQQEINDARAAYNSAIAEYVGANSTRLALADVNAGLGALVTAGIGAANGVYVTPKIDPPTGIYSEDGAHPNTRGYAFIANIFIDAINAKFGAKVPKVNLSRYTPTGLPIDAD